MNNNITTKNSNYPNLNNQAITTANATVASLSVANKRCPAI